MDTTLASYLHLNVILIFNQREEHSKCSKYKKIIVKINNSKVVVKMRKPELKLIREIVIVLEDETILLMDDQFV